MSMTKEGKTILFLCKCASNISKQVDFSRIKQWLRKGTDVDVCVTGNLLCSPKEKELFVKALKHYKPIKSIIIAGCSPKQHEKTFQNLAESAGVNMSKVQFANIREHCAYVTKDPLEATDKAKHIINAAIKRSFKAEDLTKMTMKVRTEVVIIGGGIAGIEAALTLSRAGRKVYIIDKNISLGGAVIQTEEVAPYMDCAPCLLAPVLSQIREDKNIEVITNGVVEDILGFFGNFKVKVRKRSRFIKDNCIGCEECFEVCPEDVPYDFHRGLGTRKAIYTLFAGSVPQTAAIDKDHCRHFTNGSCSACEEVCPFQSIDFTREDEHLTLLAGSIIVATGFSLPAPEALVHLGYGTLKNVYTSAEFERLASSNGPTEGAIVLKNGKEPGRIAVIHCAGSLDEHGIPYCSGICCTHACKIGEMIRKVRPGTIVYNIHKDLVFPDPMSFNFYQHQKKEGTEFIYCKDLSTVRISEVEEKGNLNVACEGLILHDIDMVVLVTGMKPAAGTDKLADMLHCVLTPHNYLAPDHSLLHMTGTTIDGVYMAGCAVKPSNVPDSITQARAAAGDILSKLIPDKEIELEVMTAYINPEKCGGCKLCLTVCPYKAITFDPEKQISVVNEAICRGCGTCVATCPGNAAKAKHFTDEQIFAEIEGMLDA
ncbi:MAG: CoB--CoM heterodisulfide reductase iron-sulfur subunit A family protein [Spirochaetales bacterium]|nr:CoB--CoM heterodisulfide reductase iron-sulfur subunit A family protein [Spirochaetales bacterium]